MSESSVSQALTELLSVNALLTKPSMGGSSPERTCLFSVSSHVPLFVRRVPKMTGLRLYSTRRGDTMDTSVGCVG